MDTDWCLSCDRHFEGSGPYCSTACQSSSSLDTDELLDPPTWVGCKDPAGIIAWAAHIPPGPPQDEESPSTPTTFQPPKLLHTQRPPPTLGMSTPQPARTTPSRPISTPQQHIAALSIETGSMGKTSLLSALTDSPIATPVSARPVPVPQPRTSVLTTLATHVRSWVSPQPSPTQHQPPHKFTILAKAHPSSSALKIISSSRSSLDDHDEDDGDTPPAWWLSSTIVLNTPSKPPPRTRGRRLTRAMP